MSTKGAHNLQNKEIMKREQIMKIFRDYSVTHGDLMSVADAILALPLEVPNEEEIEETLWEEINIPLSEKDRENNTVAYKQYKETFLWMRWIRNEIIKRNK